MDNDYGQFMFQELYEAAKRKPRVPTWCKRCGRKHKGKCDLVRIIRTAKGSGKKVERLIHASLVSNEGQVLEDA